MERHQYDLKSESRDADFNQSIFMSQGEALRKEREFDTKSSRNRGSASTYLQLNVGRQQIKFQRKGVKITSELANAKEEINRAQSIRGPEQRNRIRAQSEEKSAQEDFNSHLLKLKVEEMAFKFKSRIGTLLKQVGISVNELTNFTTLVRIDDILSFLSDRVKERLLTSQITETKASKLLSKQKQLIKQYEQQIESLQKRLEEKELTERNLKIKLKDNHCQLRQLYDKVNLKEKQLSLRITQLYQNKVILRQNQKITASLQEKIYILEKQKAELSDSVENSSKKKGSEYQKIEQQNIRLKEQLDQLNQLIEMAAQKEVRLIESNRNMSEQVARWRERFEQQRGKVNEKQILIHHDFSSNSDQKVSQSLQQSPNIKNSYQQTHLLQGKILELEAEIRRLRKDIATSQGYKLKYQKLLGTDKMRFNEEGDQKQQKSLQKDELQKIYNKKIEENSREWMNKTIEIVNEYQTQEEVYQQDIKRLEEDKKALQKKIFTLANQKYLAECKIIEKQQQIYQLKKFSKNLKTNDVLSEELLISSPDIRIPLMDESDALLQKIRNQSLKQSKEIVLPSKDYQNQIQ